MHGAESNNLKLKLVSILILAILLSFTLYLIIVKCYIDPYLKNYSDLYRSPLLFEFYKHNEMNCKKVYYWGSSVIKEDIDAELIDKLSNKFCNFNLANPASTPLRRLIELDNAIASKPHAVVFSVGYMSFSDQWMFPDDQYALISPYVKINKNSELGAIYNDAVKNLVNMNQLDLLLYKRKFLFAATNKNFELFRQKFLGAEKPYRYTEYNKDFKSLGTLSSIGDLHDPDFIKRLEEKKDFSEYDVPLANNSEKTAFEYAISKLLSNGIEVIVVKVPLNPALTKIINVQSKNNFDSFLEGISSKYDIPVFDYTSVYGGSYFYDGHHLNKIGKEEFSKSLGSKVLGALEHAV